MLFFNFFFFLMRLFLIFNFSLTYSNNFKYFFIDIIIQNFKLINILLFNLCLVNSEIWRFIHVFYLIFCLNLLFFFEYFCKLGVVSIKFKMFTLYRFYIYKDIPQLRDCLSKKISVWIMGLLLFVCWELLKLMD